MYLDLETLRRIKFMFNLHSDFSTQCNAYHSLCGYLEEAEAENKVSCSADVKAEIIKEIEDQLLFEMGAVNSYSEYESTFSLERIKYHGDRARAFKEILTDIKKATSGDLN